MQTQIVRTQEEPKNIFRKAIWKIQNMFNASPIRDAEVTHPDVKFDRQPVVKEIPKESDLVVNTFDMMDIVREGVTFEIPQTRKFKYKQFREMIKTNELISTIVDIYADNIVASDSFDGSMLHINTKDEEISQELSGLFFDRLDIDNSAYDIAYEVVSMGDSFWEVVPSDMMDGIDTIRKLYCMEKIHRIEKDGRLVAFFVEDETPWRGPDLNNTHGAASYFTDRNDFNNFAIDLEKYLDREKIQSGRILMPWQIIHFRLANRLDDYAPYGLSILHPISYTWQLLRPLEDSLVVYRIVRAPERFKFYVEVGNMSPQEALAYLGRVKDMNNKEPFIDTQTGQINKKYLALDALSNYYLPMRNGNRSIELDTIAAGQNLGEIKDVEYFNKKIRIAAGVPQAYLQEETTDARTRPLSQLDVQFAKRVQRIQKQIVKGLTKLAIEHLYLAGYREKIRNFRLSLVAPSALEKQIRYELFTEKFAVAGQIASSNMWSTYTIQRKILGMTKEEAEHESKLIMWQQNNIMPSEGMQADQFASKDIGAIKDKIEGIAAGKNPQEQELGGLGGMEMGGGLGGAELGGMEMGGGLGGAELGGMEPGGMPGATPPAGEAGAAPAGARMESISDAMMKTLNEAIENIRNGSSASGRDEFIHLFNEGELDSLGPIGDKTKMLNEQIAREIIEG